nr:F-box/LRR-repeat protein 4-like [Leptinotarsa decemlineata]
MEGKKVNNFQPIEEIVLMRHVEYYVSAVTDCSSRFNYSNSVYYSPRNLIGRYERYPAYGDFPETYSLRTYGTWWKESEGYQSDYRPQDADPLGAQDFLVVRFEGPAIPRQIFIYEVYNPGAVVRIWGKIVYKIDLPWKLLWEGPPQTHSHNSRLFQPQITPINEMINSIRLEFNQSHLEYHYSIDAILLGGFQPWSDLMNTIFLEGFTAISIPKGKRAIQNIPNINEKQDIISYLPYELLVHIFQFLDLKSLSKCAQVSRKWKLISEEQSLWQSINLKPYWHLVNYSTLNYFKQKCKNLKKLDLSWCGNDLDSLGFACSSFEAEGYQIPFT